MEIWKEFGSYQVSSWGNVKGKFGRLLKYEKRRDGYLRIVIYEDKTRKTISIHRLVALCFLDNPDNKPCVDHIDRNIINNKVENLRWCSRQQNQMNRDKQKNNTSGFKGVSYNKQNQKWLAKIQNKHLGYYETAEEASHVYQEASKKLFGEFHHAENYSVKKSTPIINNMITQTDIENFYTEKSADKPKTFFQNYADPVIRTIKSCMATKKDVIKCLKKPEDIFEDIYKRYFG